MAITKELLSGSTNGRGVKVSATATPGTLIHTAVNVSGSKDEIWLYVVNTSATSVKATIEFGGVTVPDDLIEFTVPAEDGLYLLIPGIPCDGGVEIRAFAGTTDVLVVHGWVNRVT